MDPVYLPSLLLVCQSSSLLSWFGCFLYATASFGSLISPLMLSKNNSVLEIYISPLMHDKH